MNFRKITKVGFIATLLSISMPVWAGPERIPCPARDLVKQSWQKLDTVTDNSGSYSVSTSVPAFNESNKSWAIIIGNIFAKDKNEALNLAKNSLQNILDPHPRQHFL